MFRVAGDRPTLIVVDYAEARPGLVNLLRRLADRPVEGLPPCRVVLLAREIGDWWLALRQHDADVALLLDRHLPLRLDPVPLEGELRRNRNTRRPPPPETAAPAIWWGIARICGMRAPNIVITGPSDLHSFSGVSRKSRSRFQFVQTTKRGRSFVPSAHKHSRAG